MSDTAKPQPTGGFPPSHVDLGTKLNGQSEKENAMANGGWNPPVPKKPEELANPAPMIPPAGFVPVANPVEGAHE